MGSGAFQYDDGAGECLVSGHGTFPGLIMGPVVSGFRLYKCMHIKIQYKCYFDHANFSYFKLFVPIICRIDPIVYRVDPI